MYKYDSLDGMYDGALGPGTGSFLVFALVGTLGYAFLEASAKAKIANFAARPPARSRAANSRCWP